MSALAILQAAGLRLRIGPAGQLQAAPANKLTPELRELIHEHAEELRGALALHRTWHVYLLDGTRYVAVQKHHPITAGDALAIAQEVHGAHRVLCVAPAT